MVNLVLTVLYVFAHNWTHQRWMVRTSCVQWTDLLNQKTQVVVNMAALKVSQAEQARKPEVAWLGVVHSSGRFAPAFVQASVCMVVALLETEHHVALVGSGRFCALGPSGHGPHQWGLLCRTDKAAPI